MNLGAGPLILNLLADLVVRCWIWCRVKREWKRDGKNLFSLCFGALTLTVQFFGKHLFVKIISCFVDKTWQILIGRWYHMDLVTWYHCFTQFLQIDSCSNSKERLKPERKGRGGLDCLKLVEIELPSSN